MMSRAPGVNEIPKLDPDKLVDYDSIEEVLCDKDLALYTTKEVVDLTGISRSSLSKWSREGRVPFIKEGNCHYYDNKQVAEAVAIDLKHKKRVLAELRENGEKVPLKLIYRIDRLEAVHEIMLG